MSLRQIGSHLLALGAVAGLLAGCVDAPVKSASPTSPPTPEPTPPTTTYQLNTTVWYEGLLIHVDTVTATLDERGGPVLVALRLENPAPDDSDLDARILLQVDPASAPLAPTRDSKIPTAPANNTASTVLTYELQGIPSVDGAVLLIGVAPLHVARVPFTSAGGPALAYEPVALTASGTNVAGDLRITLRSGLLRWDLPDWSQELPATSGAVTLTYDVTYSGSFSGGFAFTGDNVALRLPDGTWISPRRDGHSQSIELIAPGKTKVGLSSRFEIPESTTGKFALIVRNGGTSKPIVFTIGG